MEDAVMADVREVSKFEVEIPLLAERFGSSH